MFHVREFTRRKGGSPKLKGLHPTSARANAGKKRRDLRRDVMKRRLREDLMEISQD
jgi:hypothetical protein